MVAAADRARRSRSCASDEGERDEHGLRELGHARRAGPARVVRRDAALARRASTSSDGEIAIYVARGSLEVELDGTIHELAEGDTLRFDGTIPHRLRRTGGTNTRALIVAAA